MSFVLFLPHGFSVLKKVFRKSVFLSFLFVSSSLFLPSCFCPFPSFINFCSLTITNFLESYQEVFLELSLCLFCQLLFKYWLLCWAQKSSFLSTLVSFSVSYLFCCLFFWSFVASKKCSFFSFLSYLEVSFPLHFFTFLVVRAVLGLLNVLSLSYMRKIAEKHLGKDTGKFLMLVYAIQFHLPFYFSRTFPNNFALILGHKNRNN